MELKFKILLLLIISTCLGISNCMVIPEQNTNQSIKLEEIEAKSIEIKPLETDLSNITNDDPQITSTSQMLPEMLEPINKAFHNSLNSTESESMILNKDLTSNTESTEELATAVEEDRSVKNVEEDSSSSLIIQNITGNLIKLENNIPKQNSNQNQYEKEEIIQLPPTINFEEQIKNIMKEKGSLSEIPDLEIRKTIMTELLDVDYPQNIRPNHSFNALDKVKEVVKEKAQIAKVDEDNMTSIDLQMSLATDSKYDEALEKIKVLPQKLNENEEAKTATDENTNILNINDELKSGKNLELKKKSRQLNVLHLETNSVSNQTESNEIGATEDNSMKIKTEQEIEDAEDDLFFADVIEPSKTQKSIFYLKIDTKTPFDLLNRDRLLRWMDRQSRSMKFNETKTKLKNKIEESKLYKNADNSIKTFAKLESEKQIALSDLNSINSQLAKEQVAVAGDVVEKADWTTPVVPVKPLEVEIYQSPTKLVIAEISEKPIEVNTASQALNLLSINYASKISENVSGALIEDFSNEFQISDNLNLNDSMEGIIDNLNLNDSMEGIIDNLNLNDSMEGIIVEKKKNSENTTSILAESKEEQIKTADSTTIIPDINQSMSESTKEKKNEQLQKLESIIMDSSEESSESKEHQSDNKTENPKKDSSEENSSESKESVEKLKPKKNSSEENSKEVKETKSKKNKNEKTQNNKINKNENDENMLSVTESSIDIAETTSIADIRINSNDEGTNETETKNITENISSESNESPENSLPKGRSLDLSAVAAKNMLKKSLPNHDVFRKSVGEYDENNDSQLKSEFSSDLQPNPSLKVLLPSFQEKNVPSLTFETTTLLPQKIILKNQEKSKQIPNIETLNPSQMSEIAVDANILNEIQSSDDAIASASIGKESRNIEADNKSIISYLLSSTVAVMVVGILMGTFYKYRGKQGTLNIELEERKNGKENNNLNDELQEISISTPSNSDDISCQSNSLLTTPSIISSENNLVTANVSSALLNELNENNASTIIITK